MRILAVATKQVKSTDVDPYKDLAFVGLVGLLDPPRRDVQGAIASCRNAKQKDGPLPSIPKEKRPR